MSPKEIGEERRGEERRVVKIVHKASIGEFRATLHRPVFRGQSASTWLASPSWRPQLPRRTSDLDREIEASSLGLPESRAFISERALIPPILKDSMQLSLYFLFPAASILAPSLLQSPNRFQQVLHVRVELPRAGTDGKCFVLSEILSDKASECRNRLPEPLRVRPGVLDSLFDGLPMAITRSALSALSSTTKLSISPARCT